MVAALAILMSRVAGGGQHASVRSWYRYGSNTLASGSRLRTPPRSSPVHSYNQRSTSGS